MNNTTTQTNASAATTAQTPTLHNPNPKNHDLTTARGFCLARCELMAAEMDRMDDPRAVAFRRANVGAR